MSLYIVRVSDGKEAVGVLSADSLDELRDMVDELCDPNGCDYRRVACGGGFFFKAGAHSLPRKMTEDNGAADPNSKDYVTLESEISEFTEVLTNFLHAADDKGWKPLRPGKGTWPFAPGGYLHKTMLEKGTLSEDNKPSPLSAA